MEYVLLAILLYLGYRFVTGFVLPIYRTTKKVKEQMNNMRDQFNQQQGYNGYSNEETTVKNGKTTIKGIEEKPKYDVEGEYIKFEEVKD